MNKFSTIAQQVVMAKTGGAMTEGALAVLDHATEVDRLTRVVAADARTLAADMLRFAENAEAGRIGPCVTGSSLWIDIAKNRAALTAKTESFYTLLRIAFGKEVLKEFKLSLAVAS